MDFARPFVAAETIFTQQLGLQDTTGFRAQTTTNLHDVTSSYDGFTIYCSTGNTTGSVSVYGYK